MMSRAARPESVTFPDRMIWSATVRTIETGMANPIPGAAPPPCSLSVAARVGMPMISLSRFTRAPPLLPGLMAAEVCTMSASVAPVPPPERPSLTVRPTAETMPWVTLLERPSGEPIARTICPTSTSSVSPNSAARSPRGRRPA